MTVLTSITDGIVTLRAATADDVPALIAGRDAEWRRFLGPGAPNPRPTACIIVDGDVIGWVDYDVDRTWLEPGEVNLGYHVFAPHRGRGFATRSVQLLMHHLACATQYHTATLLIHPENVRSLALAARTRFTRRGDLDGNPYFKRAIPPLTYSDGVVTIRRQRIDDIDADLEAKDDTQIDWLWLPGQRDAWERMTHDEQRAHALRGLAHNRATFGHGPKWTFAVDTAATQNDAAATYVAYVDCDLANPYVPRGAANISYSAHPAYRGRGYVARAVRLLLGFLRDHTGAREAHLIIDTQNTASLRVARAVGAEPREQWRDAEGHQRVRYVRAV
jgi:RimJ/RimL family protein N-acetyltransferase